MDMFLELLFLISGVCLAFLIFEKARTMKKDRGSLFLRVISLGDERMKDLSHRTAHLYADKKEDAIFFVKKQLPLHTRNIYNKSSAALKESANVIVGDLRGSRFLKKSDGLSEFFRSLSEKENGTAVEDTKNEDDLN
jgi:hypothetical protein